MPKSPRKPSPKSSAPHPKTAAKPKAPKLQGKAAKLANLKKAPSHQPKRKGAAQTKPAKPAKPAPPHSSIPPAPLDNWTSLPLAHRRRHERMTHIDAWLQRVWRQDDGSVRLKNANDFAAELRVGVDTIYADIEEMKTTWRMPIGYNSKRHGYYYTQEVAFSPFLQLSQAEMLSLSLAELFIAGIPNIPVLPDLHSAVCKIFGLFGSRLQFDPAKVAEKFTFAPSRRSHKVDPQHWHIVTKALLLQTSLSLNYTKLHGEGAGTPEDRRGDPVQMVYEDGSFYILNHDDKRDDYRKFQLGRINTVEDTGVPFQVPADFNREELLSKDFSRAFTSGDPEHVVLHFLPRVKGFVLEGNWHDTQTFEERPDGVLVMTMDVPIAPDVIIWIGGFHNDCRVIAPAELRDEIMKKRHEAAMEEGWNTLQSGGQ